MGSFWVSDEYGPHVYKFGKMVLALQPPSAFLPRRNGTVNFSAGSPPVYDPDETPIPEDPRSGRANNQGFERLTVSPDGTKLYVMIQSALNQEGGPDNPFCRPARVLEYDIFSDQPKYLYEYVVMLPTYLDYTEEDEDDTEKVAVQSEIHQLPTGDLSWLATRGSAMDKSTPSLCTVTQTSSPSWTPQPILGDLHTTTQPGPLLLPRAN